MPHLIVFVHWLGGSAETWNDVVRELGGRGHRCLALDLPGFGAAVDDERYSVGEMVEAVASKIESGDPWTLMGHSMGGKVASALARAAADGDPRLAGLAGLVLVSGSPPEPEPMPESKRAELLASKMDRAQATKFVRDNVGEPPLDAPALEKAVDIVVGHNRAAWTAWLASGSEEDWSARIGVLPQRVLLVCGEKEGDLGKDTQQKFATEHAKDAQLVVLAGTGHLAPLERPTQLAAIVDLFISSRTSSQTREVLIARLAPPASAALTAHERSTLQALVRCVVPGAPVEIAARVEHAIVEGPGDGWRHDALPPDLVAWRKHLAALDSRDGQSGAFAALSEAKQTSILDEMTAKEASAWFADARALIAMTYMSDPRTMARVGFHGYADVGGFTQIRLGEAEETHR